MSSFLSCSSFVEELRTRIRAKQATAEDFVLYNLARGVPAVVGFRPYVNARHTRNGVHPSGGFMRAVVNRTGDSVKPELAKILSNDQVASLQDTLVRQGVGAFDQARTASASNEVARGFLIQAMRVTPQGSVSVLEHCRQSRRCVTNLQIALHNNHGPESLPAWVPIWYWDSPELILSRAQRAELYVALEYHDCGKPFVYSRDQEGRIHFPKHAEKSADIWSSIGGSDDQVRLMRRDMEVHTMSAIDVPSFAADPDAPMLLVGALASLWANADDFGGVGSPSFKMKLKQVDRRGRAICKYWSENRE